MKFFTFSMLFFSLLFCACSSDEEDESCGNQELAGTFAAKEFNFQAGRASVSADRIGFSMYNDATIISAGVCNQSLPMDISIFGSFVNRTGRIDLSFDAMDANITLFDEADFLNIPIFEGYIDISSIDNNEVRGFMDIGDSEDFVCGDFVLTVCL